jgi:hypothetical protein
MLNILGHKKMQIKSMLQFHRTPVGMATINNTNNKCWQRCKENELLYTVGGDVN